MGERRIEGQAEFNVESAREKIKEELLANSMVRIPKEKLQRIAEEELGISNYEPTPNLAKLDLFANIANLHYVDADGNLCKSYIDHKRHEGFADIKENTPNLENKSARLLRVMKDDLGLVSNWWSQGSWRDENMEKLWRLTMSDVVEDERG